MPFKTLRRLEGNSTVVVADIPMGVSGISWCQPLKSIVMSDMDASKVIASSQEGGLSEVFSGKMSSPRGICFNESTRKIHVEQGGGDNLFVGITVPSMTIGNVIPQKAHKSYRPSSKGAGVPSMRTNGLCAVGGYLSMLMPHNADNSIISISSTGELSRVIGGGGKGFSISDNVLAIRFFHPCGVAWNRKRNIVFVADTGNHIIREFPVIAASVGPGRIIGSPHVKGYRDGECHEGLFLSPTDMASSHDHAYVVDAGNMIRRIDVDTMAVTTVYRGDGMVESVACDNRGVLYFTEVNQHAA